MHSQVQPRYESENLRERISPGVNANYEKRFHSICILCVITLVAEKQTELPSQP